MNGLLSAGLKSKEGLDTINGLRGGVTSSFLASAMDDLLMNPLVLGLCPLLIDLVKAVTEGRFSNSALVTDLIRAAPIVVDDEDFDSLPLSKLDRLERLVPGRLPNGMALPLTGKSSTLIIFLALV